MPKIRVLIVDDSVVIRRLLSDELAKDPHLEVVGTAATGKIALAKIPQVNPDIVTMDIEMPEMDGLEAVTEARKLYPTLPIIMFSTLSQRAARETLEALSRGANDYVTKPANVGSASLAMQRVREELIPKLKALCPHLSKTPPVETNPGTSHTLVVPPPPRKILGEKESIDIVAIGVSTGGPNALGELIEALPTGLPVPIVIVQHMPPVFTKCLADRLTARGKTPVEEGTEGLALQAGHAYLAPGDFHMEVVRRGLEVQVTLTQDPPENSCRPAVDVMFRSVRRVYGAKTLGVVLTGMGYDGLRGSEVLREAGAQILAQDEATSVVWGMPGAIAAAGLADKILPLSLMAQEIVTRVQRGRVPQTVADPALR